MVDKMARGYLQLHLNGKKTQTKTITKIIVKCESEAFCNKKKKIQN